MEITTRTVYLISCKDPLHRQIYIGSTSNMANRAYLHALQSETNNARIYQYIRLNGGWDNFQMTAIETLVCSKIQIRMREQYHITAYRSELNVYLAYRSREDAKAYNLRNANEYYTANKQHVLAQKKLFYAANKERLKQYSNARYRMIVEAQKPLH